jgi:polycomb protein EED
MKANLIKTAESFTTPVPSERVLELGDPFRMRKPDHTVTADTKLSARMHFGTSQIAWSPDGTWMVGVGDYGMMTMFHRSQAAVEK